MAGLIRRKQAMAVAEAAEAEPAPVETAPEAADLSVGPARRSAGNRVATFVLAVVLGMALVAFLALRPDLAPAVVGYGLIALTLYGVLRLFVLRSRPHAPRDAVPLPEDTPLPLPEAPADPYVLTAADAASGPRPLAVGPAPAEATPSSLGAPAAGAPPAAPGGDECAEPDPPPAPGEQLQPAPAADVVPLRAQAKPRPSASRLTSEEAVARLPVSLRQWMEARGATIPPERPAARWSSASAEVSPLSEDAGAAGGRPSVTFARMLSRRRAELKTGTEPAGYGAGEAG